MTAVCVFFLVWFTGWVAWAAYKAMRNEPETIKPPAAEAQYEIRFYDDYVDEELIEARRGNGKVHGAIARRER